MFVLLRALLMLGLSAAAIVAGPWASATAMGNVATMAGATLLAAYVCARWVDRRSHSGMGLPPSRANWHELGLGLALGAAMMMATVGVGLVSGWLKVGAIWAGYAGPGSLALSLSLWLLVGLHEEVWARGYLLTSLTEGLCTRWLSPRWALLLAWAGTSVYFGLLHADNPSATPASTVAVMAAGLLLGLGVLLTGRLGLSIGIHITWNLFQGTVFGLPVSGHRVSPFNLFALQAVGPPRWTGGEFGPEGGLLGLIGLATGLVGLLLLIKWRTGRLALAAPPLLDEAAIEH